MAYPPTIATLHFQYKTAFDALKMFTDNNDDQLALMVLDFKSKKELSKPKLYKAADKATVQDDKTPDDKAPVQDDKAPVQDDKPKSKSKVSKLK